MGGERASSTRMRRSGKICCNCGAMLPPPYGPGERLCERCQKERSPRRRVYMHFILTTGWYCQFLEADLKTPLARKVTIRDENKLFEMAERGGFKMTDEAREAIHGDIMHGRGGIWLDLSEEQYKKLRRPYFWMLT